MSDEDQGKRAASGATAGFSQEAYAALARGMPASDVWSLLLGAMRERAEHRTAGELVHQWQRDRFVQLDIDQRTLVELDSHLLAAAQDFEAVELSPACPARLMLERRTDQQNRVVSTPRGTEVVSDPTNVLALESTRRLREDPIARGRGSGDVVIVACALRRFPNLPGFAAHFRHVLPDQPGHELKDQAFVT